MSLYTGAVYCEVKGISDRLRNPGSCFLNYENPAMSHVGTVHLHKAYDFRNDGRIELICMWTCPLSDSVVNTLKNMEKQILISFILMLMVLVVHREGACSI